MVVLASMSAYDGTRQLTAVVGGTRLEVTAEFHVTPSWYRYLVEVFLVRDKDVISGKTTPLVISKVGVDAAVFDFARNRSLAYGAIAVMMAVMAGWIASLPFRNT